MILSKKQRRKNNGSSFVMVIVTLAFISILAAAVIVAIGLAYRMKAMNIQSKNNFYFLEKSLDEIYSGVGSIAIKDLQQAYDETVEVMVYYDTESKSYVTLPETAANKLLKEKFIYYVYHNEELRQANLYSTLNNYISDPYDAVLNPYGTELLNLTDLATKLASDGTRVTIKNVVVKRTTKDDYVQTIATDMYIRQPDFDVNFNGMANDLSSLYDYAVVADRGLEVNNRSKVLVAGNVYAASDYYNKEYDKTDADGGNNKNRVCTYSVPVPTDANLLARYNACDGISQGSMNSGIYVTDASTLLVQGDKVIVPGTIAAFDASTITMTAGAFTTVNPDDLNDINDVWCDNIVLGGHALSGRASKVDIRANMYVQDDLEVNADGAKVSLYGTYEGYNYSQQSDASYMTIVPSALDAVDSSNKADPSKYAKAHTGSSAIVVNGQGTTLDLSALQELVIAGKAYIETTKSITETKGSVTNNKGEKEDIVTKTYSYVSNDASADEVEVSDYVTGESLSIKSNQLAYMPLYNTAGINGYKAFLTLVSSHCPAGREYRFEDELNQMTPIVTYKLNGDTYNFFNFTNDEVKSSYIASYAAFLKDTNSSQEYVNDILNYDKFKVENITLPTGEIYSSGAITAVKDTSVSVTAAKEFSDNLVSNKNNISAYSKLKQISDEDNDKYKALKFKLSTKLTTEETSELRGLNNDEITPINTYINVSLIGSDLDAVHYDGKVMNTGNKVWISDGDINITADDCNNEGVVRGIIICKGNVTFEAPTSGTDSSYVKKFEGLIMSGGKVYADHDMTFNAGATIVRNILSEAAATEGKEGAEDYSDICKIFKSYSDILGKDSNDKTGTSISVIGTADILGFENWKRNVIE